MAKNFSILLVLSIAILLGTALPAAAQRVGGGIDSASTAKKVRITGTVTDASDGEVLIGVSVMPKKNLSAGSSTDLNGLYVVEAEIGDVLIFDYVGYTRQEITVTGQTAVDIKLAVDNEVLQEATVVGYGTQ